MSDDLVLTPLSVAILLAELDDPYEPTYRKPPFPHEAKILRSSILNALKRGQRVVITPEALRTPLPDPRPIKKPRGRPPKRPPPNQQP